MLGLFYVVVGTPTWNSVIHLDCETIRDVFRLSSRDVPSLSLYVLPLLGDSAWKSFIGIVEDIQEVKIFVEDGKRITSIVKDKDLSYCASSEVIAANFGFRQAVFEQAKIKVTISSVPWVGRLLGLLFRSEVNSLESFGTSMD